MCVPGYAHALRGGRQHGKIPVWQAQIKDHQEQLKQAGAKAQADAEKAVKQLQQRAEEAKKASHPGPGRQRGRLEGRACGQSQGLRAAAEGLGRRPQTLQLTSEPRVEARRE